MSRDRFCAMGAVLVGAVMAAAGTANAAFFSLASDSSASNWTFSGVGDHLGTQPLPRPAAFTLLVNDDNGGNTVAYSVRMSATMTLTNATASPRGLNRFAFSYDIPQATFTFSDAATNLPVMSISVTDGLLTALGTGVATPNGIENAAWASTAGIQGNDATGSVSYTWLGADLASHGLFSGQSSIGFDDLAFTASVINTDGSRPLSPLAPRGVGLNPLTLLPATTWYSEGSYSGSAYFAPTPGGAALLGLGALAAGRRRRA